MSCEHVICARCAGPVVEGRCPACRAAKAEIHHPPFARRPQVILAAAALLALLLTLIAMHLTL